MPELSSSLPPTVHVVTAFLRHRGALLLLRRSERVGSYRGRWAAVSGYLEGDDPLERALREVEEETGIGRGQLRLVATGAPFTVPDPALGRAWRVHPFLFELDAPAVPRLDWEHAEWRWVLPGGLAGLDTVPRLAEGLRACWPEALESGAETPPE
jgi:8-oxo-dGTP pyrophosphatase MutT (NUDIX family)